MSQQKPGANGLTLLFFFSYTLTGPDVGDGKICSNELPTGPADVSPATESESSSSSDSSSSDDDDGEDSDGDDNGDDGDGDNDSNSAPTNSTSIFSTILATNLTTNNANDTANCNRISLCSTGVPTLWPNGAPPGYGPADWLFINVTNFGACNISSLNGLMPYVPISGGDTLKCGGTAYRVNFRADSSQANSTGTLRVTGPYECNPGGGGASVRGQVSAEAKIPITCSHDSGRNATCSSDASGVDLTVLSFEPATPFQ